MSIRRLTRLLFIGLVLFLVLAPAATATAQNNSPHRERAPFVPNTIEGVCAFPVFAEALADQGYIITITNTHRVFSMITGIVMVRLTNVDTGKFIELHLAGNFIMADNVDGTHVFSLHGPFIAFPNMPGLPPLAYVKGSQTLIFAPDYALIEVKTTGKIMNLCAELGD